MTNIIDFVNNSLDIELDSRQATLLKRFYKLPLTLEEFNNKESQEDYEALIKEIELKHYE